MTERRQFMCDFMVALAEKLCAPQIYERRTLDALADLAADAYDALERRWAADEGKTTLTERNELSEAWEQARIHRKADGRDCRCTTCVMARNHGAECECTFCERARRGREMLAAGRETVKS